MSDILQLEDTILVEGTDYELIPLDTDVEAWGIRIQTGTFNETVLQFGAISFNEVQDCLTFNFDVVSSPDPDLSKENQELQEYAGLLLQSVIYEGVKDGTVELEEKE